MSRILDNAQPSNPRRTGVALATCLAMAAVVAGCGGGDRVKSFQPTQIVAFGDETSAFDDTATGSTPLVRFDGLPVASGAVPVTATVPYRARYTINLVGDVQFACKNAAPDATKKATCDEDNTPPIESVVAADYPSANSFFVTQSSVYGYRLESDVPVVNQVETGSFNDAASPATTIYHTTDHAYQCSTDFADDYGNWVQRVAHGLGGGGLSIGSGGCPQDHGNGISYAAWGAKVDDVATQVSTNIGVLRDGVLVTMLAGQNDVMAAYQSVLANTMTADAAQVLMRNKGVQLAGVINSIVNTGARVVYLTVPDMGRSPEAIAGGNPGLATALTHAFNEGYKGAGESNESGGLVLSVINNGHKIVKVDGYNQIAALSVSYPTTGACQTDPASVTMPNGDTLASAFPAFVNPSDDATRSLRDKALLLNCRSNNLIVTTAGSSTVAEIRAYYGSYLWADGRRLAPIGHASLAALAVARIRDQL